MNRPEIAFAAIGRPLRRKEDLRLITGAGQFSDDFSLDGQVYAVMVRSPHPHARIVAIDTARARAMRGVLGVFTGADIAAEGLKPIPHDPLPKTRTDLKLTGPGGGSVFIGPHALLPAHKARHVGEAVAMVVGETPTQALDAAEAVAVEYEELPWVAEANGAIEPGAPAVWDEAADNVLVDTMFGDQTATERAFAAADHVVRFDAHIGRVTAVTMEPRAALAQYDAAMDRYTLYAGSGGAVRQKRELGAVLGIEPAQLRVISYDVGGNFGARNRPYVEFGLVLWAARKLGRPVKYTATRSEAFLTDYQGRDLVTSVELALRADGRFLALRASNISNVGARCVSLSPLGKGSALVTGPYAIPAATLRSRAVFTNTMPTNAYRSSGRPEVTYAMERLIDRAADELGFDRVALRRRNLIRPNAMPYVNAVGAPYDSGQYAANMDLAMRIADWKGFAARRREAKRRGRLLGLGLANYVESSIGAPNERAEVTVTPAGRIAVVIGTQASGQGHETSFAQVMSDLLGVPVERIDIVAGDTDVVTVGGGSHSGRSMRHAATVFAKATTDLIAKGKGIAATLLETSADAISFADGRFGVASSNRSFDFLELAHEAAAQGLGPLAAAADNEMHDPVFPNGCAVCEVEVDPETGGVELTRYAAVDDVGRCINPMIVHGQTHGGIAQGVGEALWEQCFVDPQSGQPLCGSLMDYGMPRANTMPSFATEIVEVLSPTNPLGIKAGGEGGTTPTLAVVVSAILDALKGYGVRDITMPATPFAVWQAIRGAQANRAATAA
ncbi:MAG: xanthine dehydrogenase family protein molybdopterin-binding subunit [Hyphomicrobiales bacterium]|nr:xanthine dehydrogenase family protein molybdopterin-binding subunit [Hyphomicrobiales bacterium]MBV8827394.1 xanthine dehydrogenase family protein molybdopterin-binding subunit [Hyphomicrobiales bacterium]MBV9428904.1 xanthine dehydrogenase family protein molybdopterin-binding subunit [Bradyrhizobiaceae bacterium]